jgi:hypothetical protein
MKWEKKGRKVQSRQSDRASQFHCVRVLFLCSCGAKTSKVLTNPAKCARNCELSGSLYYSGNAFRMRKTITHSDGTAQTNHKHSQQLAKVVV